MCSMGWKSVDIPKKLRLAELHDVHPGVTRMKALARLYVVAKHGQRNRRRFEDLRDLLLAPKQSSGGSNTHVGVSKGSVGKITPRFCRSLIRKDVPDRGGRL